MAHSKGVYFYSRESELGDGMCLRVMWKVPYSVSVLGTNDARRVEDIEFDGMASPWIVEVLLGDDRHVMPEFGSSKAWKAIWTDLLSDQYFAAELLSTIREYVLQRES